MKESDHYVTLYVDGEGRVNEIPTFTMDMQGAPMKPREGKTRKSGFKADRVQLRPVKNKKREGSHRDPPATALAQCPCGRYVQKTWQQIWDGFVCDCEEGGEPR